MHRWRCSGVSLSGMVQMYMKSPTFPKGCELILLFTKQRESPFRDALSLFYTPMHEVTPKVVAMAVSTVIKMFRIFPQVSLLIVLNSFS